jgi:hypothetical protein
MAYSRFPALDRRLDAGYLRNSLGKLVCRDHRPGAE